MPLRVRVPSGRAVVDVAAGYDASVLVDDAGSAFYCGQLVDNRARSFVPTPLCPRAAVGHVYQAAVGNTHVCGSIRKFYLLDQFS